MDKLSSISCLIIIIGAAITFGAKQAAKWGRLLASLGLLSFGWGQYARDGDWRFAGLATIVACIAIYRFFKPYQQKS